jgi:DNA-directed RNA polymerase specialized sigma24 family protein
VIDYEKERIRQHQLEIVMFNLWRKESGETNEYLLEHLKNCVRVAISETLTDKQRYYLGLYLYGYSQTEISQLAGVNKSTVSRTINRALTRLLSRIKYATPATLHAEDRVHKYLTRLYS